MRKTVAALAAGATALMLLTGCAQRPVAPGAGAATDRSCTASLAKARSYATRPSTVRSTATASCVFTYVDSINPTQGFTRSASIAYSLIDDHEYGDIDGVHRRSSHGTYDRASSAAYEVDETYDETATLSNEGSDSATLRYLDQKAGAVYLDLPQKVEGWTRAAPATEAGEFLLNRTHLFEPTGGRIVAWTKSASKGRNTWTFTLGGAVQGGTVRFVVASSGELLSGTSSLHWDGRQHTEVRAFTATYAHVTNVSIPPGVVAAAK